MASFCPCCDDKLETIERTRHVHSAVADAIRAGESNPDPSSVEYSRDLRRVHASARVARGDETVRVKEEFCTNPTCDRAVATTRAELDAIGDDLGDLEPDDRVSEATYERVRRAEQLLERQRLRLDRVADAAEAGELSPEEARNALEGGRKWVEHVEAELDDVGRVDLPASHPDADLARRVGALQAQARQVSQRYRRIESAVADSHRRDRDADPDPDRRDRDADDAELDADVEGARDLKSATEQLEERQSTRQELCDCCGRAKEQFRRPEHLERFAVQGGLNVDFADLRNSGLAAGVDVTEFTNQATEQHCANPLCEQSRELVEQEVQRLRERLDRAAETGEGLDRETFVKLNRVRAVAERQRRNLESGRVWLENGEGRAGVGKPDPAALDESEAAEYRRALDAYDDTVDDALRALDRHLDDPSVPVDRDVLDEFDGLTRTSDRRLERAREAAPDVDEEATPGHEEDASEPGPSRGATGEAEELRGSAHLGDCDCEDHGPAEYERLTHQRTGSVGTNLTLSPKCVATASPLAPDASAGSTERSRTDEICDDAFCVTSARSVLVRFEQATAQLEHGDGPDEKWFNDVGVAADVVASQAEQLEELDAEAVGELDSVDAVEAELARLENAEAARRAGEQLLERAEEHFEDESLLDRARHAVEDAVGVEGFESDFDRLEDNLGTLRDHHSELREELEERREELSRQESRDRSSADRDAEPSADEHDRESSEHDAEVESPDNDAEFEVSEHDAEAEASEDIVEADSPDHDTVEPTSDADGTARASDEQATGTDEQATGTDEQATGTDEQASDDGVDSASDGGVEPAGDTSGGAREPDELTADARFRSVGGEAVDPGNGDAEDAGRDPDDEEVSEPDRDDSASGRHPDASADDVRPSEGDDVRSPEGDDVRTPDGREDDVRSPDEREDARDVTDESGPAVAGESNGADTGVTASTADEETDSVAGGERDAVDDEETGPVVGEERDAVADPEPDSPVTEASESPPAEDRDSPDSGGTESDDEPELTDQHRTLVDEDASPTADDDHGVEPEGPTTRDGDVSSVESESSLAAQHERLLDDGESSPADSRPDVVAEAFGDSATGDERGEGERSDPGDERSGPDDSDEHPNDGGETPDDESAESEEVEESADYDAEASRSESPLTSQHEQLLDEDEASPEPDSRPDVVRDALTDDDDGESVVPDDERAGHGDGEEDDELELGL